MVVEEIDCDSAVASSQRNDSLTTGEHTGMSFHPSVDPPVTHHPGLEFLWETGHITADCIGEQCPEARGGMLSGKHDVCKPVQCKSGSCRPGRKGYAAPWPKFR